MLMNKWWQRLLGRSSASAPSHPSEPLGLPPEPSAPRLDRLDLQSAIIHHLEWCVQFNEYLCQIKPNEPPPVRTLPSAESSEMGRWLQDAARRTPGQHPLFASLRQAHQHFHALAEEAIRLSCDNRMDLASTLLNTEFERARAQVLRLLREMQKG